LSAIRGRDFTDALFASPQRKSANDSQIIRARFARDIPEPHCPANSGNPIFPNRRLITRRPASNLQLKFAGDFLWGFRFFRRPGSRFVQELSATGASDSFAAAKWLIPQKTENREFFGK